MDNLTTSPRKYLEVAPIPFDRVTRVLHQLTHDVRNEFGALDLEAAYIAQAATDPATAAEAMHLRKIVTEAVVRLKRLAASVGTISISPASCPAHLFAAELRLRLTKTWPVEMADAGWGMELGEQGINMDFELLAAAFARIFENAFQFREDGFRLDFRGYARGANLVFEWSETKKAVPSPPEKWGTEPFVTTRRDGYGLGLFFVRRVIGAHHGRVAIRHDAARELLVTQVVLPVEKG